MNFIFAFSYILVIFTTIECLKIESQLRNKNFPEDDDPGEALYLTKYIEDGDIETAQRLALVNHTDISIESYAGYFTVNKTFNSNLFFWFFPAKYNAKNAPVLLWLQGGPGGTSLDGLFYENGPYRITAKQELIAREHSWHLNHNLIYIDNPVGAGFSFTDSDAGYANNEVDIGQNLLKAMQQFFLLFPHLQNNEFIASGGSYAGKYVPALGYAIYQDSKRKSNEPKINLKGLAIGDGFSDPVHQSNYADYLYQLGLIDTNGYKLFLKLQNKGINCMKKRDFECAYVVFDEMLTYKYGSVVHNLTGFEMLFNFMKTKDEDITPMRVFLEKSSSRRALHVGNNTFAGVEAKKTLKNHLRLDIFDSVADWVAELLSHYPILLYSGQLDIILAYPLTENYLKHLNFSSANEYKTAKRHIWRVDDEIAGYVKQAGNLTEILVRNAGHMVGTDQPKWALDMLLRFTYHKMFY